MSKRALRFILGLVLAVSGCGRTPDPKQETDQTVSPTACGSAIPRDAAPRPSSRRRGSCDYGEELDWVSYDLLCSDGPCPPGEQPGSGLCSRVCDDGRCAAGEHCEKRPQYVSDTPTQYQELCVCDGCPEGARTSPAEGGLDAWREEAPMPRGLYYHAAAASSSHLFVSGGITYREIGPNGSSASGEVVADVSVADLDANGEVSRWRDVSRLPRALVHHAMVIAGNRLYVVGGSAAGATGFSDEVVSAAIADEGSLGAFRAEAKLPMGRAWHTVLVDGARLVVAAGSTSAAYFSDGASDLWIGALGADGEVVSWSTVKSPGAPFFDGGAGIGGGRLFLVQHETRPTRITLLSTALAQLSGTPSFQTELTWHIDNTPDTGPNFGPVRLHLLCDALTLVTREGVVATAPQDARGAIGQWRAAARVFGPETGFATAASPAQRLYLLGGTTTPIARNAAVWSTARR